MSSLMQHIEKEADVDLRTNNFFRRPLKQIGNSIFDIKSYFNPKGIASAIPEALEPTLADIRDALTACLQNCTCLQKRNIATGDISSEICRDESFVFLSHSLGVALDFRVLERPKHIICDTFIALPYQPILVLTFVDFVEEFEATREYNIHVAREVNITLRKFVDESINLIFGVLSPADLKDDVKFSKQMVKFAKHSSLYVTKHSLLMSPSKYDKVLTAFWAGVAEAKYVLVKGKVDKKYLRFLTKEQCIVLVENINNREVTVTCQPGCGASTLMLEIARRFSNLGETLIVCRSKDESERLRCLFTNTVTAFEVDKMNLKEFQTVVDETGTVKFGQSDRLWQFIRGNLALPEEELTQHILKLLIPGNAGQYQPSSIVATRILETYWQNTDILALNTDITETRETTDTHKRQDLFSNMGKFIAGVKRMIVELTAVTEYLELDLKTHADTDFASRNTTSEDMLASKGKRSRVSEPEIPHKIQRGSMRDIPSLPVMPAEITSSAKHKGAQKRSNRLMHYIRHFQYGTFQYSQIGRFQNNHIHLFDILEQVVNKDQNTLRELQKKVDRFEQILGFPIYIVGEIDSPRSSPVSCPSMTLDSDRVNSKLHVSEDGLELVNTKSRGGALGGLVSSGGRVAVSPSPSLPTPPLSPPPDTGRPGHGSGWRV